MKSFFQSCPSRLSNLYHCCAVDDSILPNIISGKVQFKAGISTRVTPQEYQRHTKGKEWRQNWPILVFFRTEEEPFIPDGLGDDFFYWGDDIIEAEIVAYSKDYGETYTEVTPLSAPAP